MRNLLCFVLLLCSSVVRSQDTTVVVSFSNFQFLYHGVSNLIQIGFAKMDEPYYLACSCDKITNVDALGEPLPPHTYSVFADESWKTAIWVYKLTGQDTILVSRLEFNNITLPDPELRFGAALPEQFFNPQENRLFLMQDVSTTGENYNFKILEWKTKIGKKEYSGKGHVLSSEVQKQIKKLKEKSKLEIEVRCIADDKRERVVRAFFYKGQIPDDSLPPTDENGDFIYSE